MKKLLVLEVALFFLLTMIILEKRKSYAYEDCSSKRIYPQGITTLNLSDFLKNNSYNELIRICSYEKCYEVREGNIDLLINNYNKVYYKELNEDEKLIINVKGFPITEIILNNC